MSRKKRRAPLDPAELANAVAAGKLQPDDVAIALAPRDNGLEPTPVVASKPTPMLPPSKPAPRVPPPFKLMGHFPVRCSRCGVAWAVDYESDVAYSLAQHLGEVPDVSARCLQIRREQGLI
jgi:hypothetical protein